MPCPIQSLLAMAFALALGGCATSLTTERISPTDLQRDFVSEVSSAHRQASGAVVVCVVGRVAQTPWPFKSWDTPFSLTLPPNTPVIVAKSIRREIPRYEIKTADVGGACPEKADGATALPVHRIEASRLGLARYDSLDYDTLAAHVAGPGMDGSAVWVVDYGYKEIFYLDESPRFEGRRAVRIHTGEREVPAQPAYLLLLPLAVVWDVLMFPVYLLLALGGGLH
jgi:hypothetical protein